MRNKTKNPILPGAISEKRYREIFALIQNPPPGSAIEAAKQFGTDLFATLENLRLTPQERIRRGEEESKFAQRLRQAGSKSGE